VRIRAFHCGWFIYPFSSGSCLRLVCLPTDCWLGWLPHAFLPAATAIPRAVTCLPYATVLRFGSAFLPTCAPFVTPFYTVTAVTTHTTVGLDCLPVCLLYACSTPTTRATYRCAVGFYTAYWFIGCVPAVRTVTKHCCVLHTPTTVVPQLPLRTRFAAIYLDPCADYLRFHGYTLLRLVGATLPVRVRTTLPTLHTRSRSPRYTVTAAVPDIIPPTDSTCHHGSAGCSFQFPVGLRFCCLVATHLPAGPFPILQLQFTTTFWVLGSRTIHHGFCHLGSPPSRLPLHHHLRWIGSRCLRLPLPFCTTWFCTMPHYPCFCAPRYHCPFYTPTVLPLPPWFPLQVTTRWVTAPPRLHTRCYAWICYTLCCPIAALWVSHTPIVYGLPGFIYHTVAVPFCLPTAGAWFLRSVRSTLRSRLPVTAYAHRGSGFTHRLRAYLRFTVTALRTHIAPLRFIFVCRLRLVPVYGYVLAVPRSAFTYLYRVHAFTPHAATRGHTLILTFSLLPLPPRSLRTTPVLAGLRFVVASTHAAHTVLRATVTFTYTHHALIPPPHAAYAHTVHCLRHRFLLRSFTFDSACWFTVRLSLPVVPSCRFTCRLRPRLPPHCCCLLPPRLACYTAVLPTVLDPLVARSHDAHTYCLRFCRSYCHLQDRSRAPRSSPLRFLSAATAWRTYTPHTPTYGSPVASSGHLPFLHTTPCPLPRSTLYATPRFCPFTLVALCRWITQLPFSTVPGSAQFGCRIPVHIAGLPATRLHHRILYGLHIPATATTHAVPHALYFWVPATFSSLVHTCYDCHTRSLLPLPGFLCQFTTVLLPLRYHAVVGLLRIYRFTGAFRGCRLFSRCSGLLRSFRFLPAFAVPRSPFATARLHPVAVTPG